MSLNFSHCFLRISLKDVMAAGPDFLDRVMVLNATFNNISVISWRSVLLVEETGENQTCRMSLTNFIT
jgi:hypothetical protein